MEDGAHLILLAGVKYSISKNITFQLQNVFKIGILPIFLTLFNQVYIPVHHLNRAAYKNLYVLILEM